MRKVSGTLAWWVGYRVGRGEIGGLGGSRHSRWCEEETPWVRNWESLGMRFPRSALSELGEEEALLVSGEKVANKEQCPQVRYLCGTSEP